jgi:acylphosphatase
MTTISVIVRITGRAQGVFYRGWTLEQAERRGLAGWVRNDTDGSVAALLAGPEDVVADMIEALWQGPPSAQVANVETRATEPTEPQSGFRVLR